MTGLLRALYARILSVATIAAVLILGAIATPAYALYVPWSGAGDNSGLASNLDGATLFNLGDTWQVVGGNTWQIELNNGSTPSLFNQTGVNNSFGTFATGFQFTLNNGVGNGLGGISSATLDAGTKHEMWNTAISLASQRVTLTAPAGTQLNAGDPYTLDINFTDAVVPAGFSFAALWSDSPNSNTSVPEPTTLSLFGVAALALVIVRRRMFVAI